ncbi:hypothetical protein [Fulvivirga sedimenti]|uniref:Glycosyl hydrolase family 16 n=1 Tax=Fulvivirga sedimenti TaxID=2879465 RepID=A0A9X1HTF0_9BACT|nr:hypothetical protein [Fulvivirga sedimenti]MCA6074655.1 hypothetical protein [Fulvivirga sedimenti]MCA6075832.1 hypothetical protein [Fulvivirga sedimenti]MCA6076960.1 hypothetical protein [Fulvivirga sedimenti]
MKKLKILKPGICIPVLFVAAIFSGCERNPSDDVDFAKFPDRPEVFIDGFSGGLEYLPFDGSKPDAFTVDNETVYQGSASMRFDVPNVGDPTGSFAGAIFPDYGGRNLTGYDALTFWARGSKAATINEIGFGNDFGENKFQVTINNLQISTGWKKYTIPIPDPSKLTLQKGMFWYAEGPEDGQGYSFWIDELKFEKLGTVAQSRPAILNGNDESIQAFIGVNFSMPGLTQTFNLGNGLNQTISPAPSYYTFTSTNPDVARINEIGQVSILGAGEAVITAMLGNVRAAGSLTIESLGNFVSAPTPTRDPANVISIFSDAYTNVPVDFYNGFFAPFQTTLGGADLNIGGDNIIRYTQLNFVATEFKNPTVNASGMTHLHVDIQVENPIASGDFITIELGDFGPDGEFGGGDDSSGRVTISADELSTRTWLSFDIPLADFGLSSRNNLAQIFFITDGTNPALPGNITEILVDNMYFYK